MKKILILTHVRIAGKWRECENKDYSKAIESIVDYVIFDEDMIAIRWRTNKSDSYMIYKYDKLMLSNK